MEIGLGSWVQSEDQQGGQQMAPALEQGIHVLLSWSCHGTTGLVGSQVEPTVPMARSTQSVPSVSVAPAAAPT